MTAPLVQKVSTNLSLIISSLDEGPEINETLRSVFAGSVLPSETLIVDDGSTDGSCDDLERLWGTHGVTVHRIARSGIAAARNVGASLARGAQLVFLDAHCRLDPNCLAELNTALIAEPDRIFVPAFCDFGCSVYGCGAKLIDAALRVRWLPPSVGSDPLPRIPIAPGGCLAISRPIFNYLDGFGIFRELGQEDVEFSLRAWRTGVDIIALSSAKLAHRFRAYPTYHLSATSRSYNVARVALIHFDGPRREQCLRKVIGTPRASEVLVDAIASDWQVQRNKIEACSSRTIEAFFDRFGDWS